MLECVGLDMDEEYDDLRINDPLENKTFHLRLTGVNLIANMEFLSPSLHGEAHDDVLCKIRLEAILGRSLQMESDHVQVPSPSASYSLNIGQLKYGITVSIRVAGSIAVFDPYQLLDALLNLVVLMSLPIKIIMFICMHMLGSLSYIYRDQIVEVFDMRDAIRGLMGRLFRHAAAFRVFSTELAKDQNTMGSDFFRQKVHTICKPYSTSGVSSESELEVLASFLHEQFD